jgi:hypothetical protein
MHRSHSYWCGQLLGQGLLHRYATVPQLSTARPPPSGLTDCVSSPASLIPLYLLLLLPCM